MSTRDRAAEVLSQHDTIERGDDNVYRCRRCQNESGGVVHILSGTNYVESAMVAHQADALDRAGLLAHEPDQLADIWDEGHSDGVWNTEHEAMIERGNREAIRNPYREGQS